MGGVFGRSTDDPLPNTGAGIADSVGLVEPKANVDATIGGVDGGVPENGLAWPDPSAEVPNGKPATEVEALRDPNPLPNALGTAMPLMPPLIPVVGKANVAARLGAVSTLVVGLDGNAKGLDVVEGAVPSGFAVVPNEKAWGSAAELAGTWFVCG